MDEDGDNQPVELISQPGAKKFSVPDDAPEDFLAERARINNEEGATFGIRPDQAQRIIEQTAIRSVVNIGEKQPGALSGRLEYNYTPGINQLYANARASSLEGRTYVDIETYELRALYKAGTATNKDLAEACNDDEADLIFKLIEPQLSKLRKTIQNPDEFENNVINKVDPKAAHQYWNTLFTDDDVTPPVNIYVPVWTDLWSKMTRAGPETTQKPPKLTQQVYNPFSQQAVCGRAGGYSWVPRIRFRSPETVDLGNGKKLIVKKPFALGGRTHLLLVKHYKSQSSGEAKEFLEFSRKALGIADSIDPRYLLAACKYSYYTYLVDLSSVRMGNIRAAQYASEATGREIKNYLDSSMQVIKGNMKGVNDGGKKITHAARLDKATNKLYCPYYGEEGKPASGNKTVFLPGLLTKKSKLVKVKGGTPQMVQKCVVGSTVFDPNHVSKKLLQSGLMAQDYENYLTKNQKATSTMLQADNAMFNLENKKRRQWGLKASQWFYNYSGDLLGQRDPDGGEETKTEGETERASGTAIPFREPSALGVRQTPVTPAAPRAATTAATTAATGGQERPITALDLVNISRSDNPIDVGLVEKDLPKLKTLIRNYYLPENKDNQRTVLEGINRVLKRAAPTPLVVLSTDVMGTTRPDPTDATELSS